MMRGHVDFDYIAKGFEQGIVERAGLKEIAASLESMSYPQRYGLLESALAEAVDRDVISPLPTSKPSSKHDYAISRLKTMRNRLFMLGYLDKDSGQAHLGPMLEAGIKAFQKEARCVISDFSVDGWVGEETWTALQELVSFEEPSNLERWFIGSVPSEALKRAIQLRLYAFGLCFAHPSTAPDDGEITTGLSRFSNIAHLLHLSDHVVSPRPVFETVRLLMDQDDLVRRLSRSEPFSQQLRDELEASDPELLRSGCSFVINITKAELWMLGYEHVAPSGYQDADTRRSVDQWFVPRGGLFSALNQFWKDRGDGSNNVIKTFPALLNASDDNARDHVIKSFPAFFYSIDLELSRDVTDDPVDSQYVYDALHQHFSGKHGDSFIQLVWSQLRAIGSRIWDGVRRARRWFKSNTKLFLKNISRLAYNFILKSFEAVRAVVSGVVGSLNFFGKNEIVFPLNGLGIDPQKTLFRMRHDYDFDFISLVDTASPANDIEVIVGYLENKSSMFAVSCRFLASLLEMVIDLIKGGLFTGWAVLLMALLRLYKSIEQWAPVIIAFEREEERMLASGGDRYVA